MVYHDQKVGIPECDAPFIGGLIGGLVRFEEYLTPKQCRGCRFTTPIAAIMSCHEPLCAWGRLREGADLMPTLSPLENWNLEGNSGEIKFLRPPRSLALRVQAALRNLEAGI